MMCKYKYVYIKENFYLIQTRINIVNQGVLIL